MTYIIVDAAHLYARCRHVTQGDAFTRSGMALHIMFRSIKKVWNQFHGSHIVFCTEGGSWRTSIHPEYKAHRKVARLQMTAKEKEDDEVFAASFAAFIDFLTTKTRCTVLHAYSIEGDDFVAYWIRQHPDDQHVILSGDSDFVQLLAANVTVFDGIKDLTITTEGVIDAEGRRRSFSIKSDSKLKIGDPDANFVPEKHWWRRVLFTKIMRGDSSDNVFSAFPYVQAKKLTEAFADRDDKGYAWNNLMLQTWVDHQGKERRVLDAYRYNEQLIDLSKQPDTVTAVMDEAMRAVHPPVSNVGIHFLRFCKQHSLITLSKEAEEHAVYLNMEKK